MQLDVSQGSCSSFGPQNVSIFYSKFDLVYPEMLINTLINEHVLKCS